MRTLYHKPTQKASFSAKAFTIVELLIVIVVIAILAAITIVAYNGIQERARASAVISTISQAKKKLEVLKTDTGVYPLTDDFASTTSLSNTSDTAYQYTSANGQAYYLTVISKDIVYRTTPSQEPTPGCCPDQDWPGAVEMTNLVVNGDFSGGIGGWSGAPQFRFESGHPMLDNKNHEESIKVN